MLSKGQKVIFTKDKILFWLTGRNSFFTTIMDGVVVTNAKLLSVGHVMSVCYILLRNLESGYSVLGLILLWLMFAVIIWMKVK